MKAYGGTCVQCDHWLSGLTEAVDHLIDGHGISIWKIWVRPNPCRPGYRVAYREYRLAGLARVRIPVARGEISCSRQSAPEDDLGTRIGIEPLERSQDVGLTVLVEYVFRELPVASMPESRSYRLHQVAKGSQDGRNQEQEAGTRKNVHETHQTHAGHPPLGRATRSGSLSVMRFDRTTKQLESEASSCSGRPSRSCERSASTSLRNDLRYEYMSTG